MLDLKDAYLHVPILLAQRLYLIFAFHGKTLPIQRTPVWNLRVFAEILAMLVGLIHHQGIRFQPYSDDCLLLTKTPSQLSKNITSPVDIMQRAEEIILRAFARCSVPGKQDEIGHRLHSIVRQQGRRFNPMRPAFPVSILDILT